MGLAVTAEALIASAQRRAFMPANGNGLSAAEWLQILNEALFGYAVPFITKRRQNYFLASQDTTLVSGQASYAIPSRSAGARFFAVQFLDSSGNPATPMLPPMEPEEALAWPTTVLTSGQPIQYAVVGNLIVLAPAPQTPIATPTMRVWYYRRPSTLVLVTSTMAITAYTIAGVPAGQFRALTTATAPSGFIVGANVELVRSASGFETDGPFPIATVNAGSSMDLTGTLPAAAAAGDSLCLSETANVVTNFPADWAWWVAQAGALGALASRGDDAKYARAEKEMERLEASVDSQLNQRDVAGRHKARNGQMNFGVRRSPFFAK